MRKIFVNILMRNEEILDYKIYSKFDNANKCKCHECYENILQTRELN